MVRRRNSDAAITTNGFMVTNLTLVTDTSAPLAYAPGLELHHPIMSEIEGHGGRLDIYIYISK